MPRPNSKTEVVKIRLTAKDKTKIEAIAQKRGETTSSFIRDKTLKNLDKQLKELKDWFDKNS